MASHPTDNPLLLSTPKVGNSPKSEEEHFHPKILYAIPHEKVNQFKRITRAYARQIGALSLSPILPRRKQQSRPVVSTPEEILDNQPWLVGDVMVIPGRVHNLPWHPKKLLPEYDPETSGLPEDHIKKFILVIRLMNVQHEYVVCRLFPYTFENLASTWYFNLLVGSITS
jgi:hypothetical protein